MMYLCTDPILIPGVDEVTDALVFRNLRQRNTYDGPKLRFLPPSQLSASSPLSFSPLPCSPSFTSSSPTLTLFSRLCVENFLSSRLSLDIDPLSASPSIHISHPSSLSLLIPLSLPPSVSLSFSLSPCLLLSGSAFVFLSRFQGLFWLLLLTGLSLHGQLMHP